MGLELFLIVHGSQIQIGNKQPFFFRAMNKDNIIEPHCPHKSGSEQIPGGAQFSTSLFLTGSFS